MAEPDVLDISMPASAAAFNNNSLVDKIEKIANSVTIQHNRLLEKRESNDVIAKAILAAKTDIPDQSIVSESRLKWSERERDIGMKSNVIFVS